jgi:hypothetical protein
MGGRPQEGKGSLTGSREMVSRGWDLGEVCWGSSVSEAFVIIESTARAEARSVFLEQKWIDVVMRRVYGL